MGLGALLILGTNLVHGWDGGFVQPISGGGLNGIQYYHDAVRVTDPGAFFRGFAQIQPNLGVHSRTHPPGAVLVIYLLLQVLQDPGAVGLALALVSTVVSGASFYGLLRRERLPEELRGYAVSLYLLTPAVQVYYAASIDALLAALLLGALYCVLNRRRGLAVAAVLLLYGASLLSFGALFALPVLAGLVAMRRVTLPRGAAVLLALVGLHGIVYAATGFDYLRSFRIASVLENPQGFRLLSEPVGYAITRVQGVLEILVYFGPFLALLAARGVRALRTGLPELWPLAPLGAGTLLAMFATGAFRTGETGRACLFVYPYVLLPVVAWLAARPPQAGERRILAAVVFGQAVLMQVAGSHFW